LSFVTLAACATKLSVFETRMIAAAPRPSNCALAFVSVDMSTPSATAWETLGWIQFSDVGVQDPMAEENRALVRPRACAMGGTAVTLGASSVGQGVRPGETSSIVYAVLRPVGAAPAPTVF